MENTLNSPQKIYLKDYQKPDFHVENISLYFDLNDSQTRVVNKTTYKTLKPNVDLFLDGEELKLVSVKMNDLPIEYSLTEDGLVIKNPPKEFQLEITTELYPDKNTALEGLYLSNGIFCTQCEAQSFRRITYFMDRPDVMTTYEVCIEADHSKYPVLLSNGDRVRSEILQNGRHRVFWKDPHKKPSYLFALVAGDLGIIKDTFKTKSGKNVELEIYAAHGKQELCYFAMEALKKSMRWDEDTYNLEYDLSTYMIVAIDDFNAGAMENKGLNIFNSRLVFANPKTATDIEYHNIESVIAHEYFHNWTGNRVTLRDWFQLSLKEGLTVFRDQEFSADMHDRGVQRIHDVESLRSKQFPEDSGPNSHPVRPSSCFSVDNFFTSTIYEKGAEVIRMMENFVGKKGFAQGMKTYFSRHDGQAVTTEDFAKAIFETNHFDHSQFLLWYEQAGTPHVEIKDNYNSEKKQYELQLNQSCAPTPHQEVKQPFHIPLVFALLNSNGEEISLSKLPTQVIKNTDGKTLINLKNTTESIVFENIHVRPRLSVLRGFSAPIYLNFDQPIEDSLFLIKHDKDLFNKKESLLKIYLTLIKNFLNGQKEIKSELIDALKEILYDQNLKPDFKAALFSLPDYELITNSMGYFAPQEFYQANEWLAVQMATQLKTEFMSYYHKLNKLEESGFKLENAGARSLKNTIIKLLATLKSDEILELLNLQFLNSKNMTDKLAAMALIANTKNKYKDNVLNLFYEEWQNDPLILNKWFAVQAVSSAEITLEQVQKLTKHAKFNIKNPNNVYSLLRNFGENNILIFHKSDLSSYKFFIEKIVEVDSVNPQVAARLCAAFNPILKLKPNTKQPIIDLISQAVTSHKLSKNTYELLSSYKLK